jgi:hypothetical protein
LLLFPLLPVVKGGRSQIPDRRPQPPIGMEFLLPVTLPNARSVAVNAGEPVRLGRRTNRRCRQSYPLHLTALLLITNDYSLETAQSKRRHHRCCVKPRLRNLPDFSRTLAKPPTVTLTLRMSSEFTGDLTEGVQDVFPLRRHYLLLVQNVSSVAVLSAQAQHIPSETSSSGPACPKSG